jgi:serine/threonine protein kinase/thiol-disulfide isomerase/thioredoxin
MSPQPSNTSSAAGRLDEILSEYRAARVTGTAPGPDELVARHPDLADQLRAYFAWEAAMGTEGDRPTLSIGSPVDWLHKLQGGDRERETMNPTGAQRGTPDPAASPTLPCTEAEVRTSWVREIADYELVEEIARGGMGIVYKARHKTLHRVVALKMILAGHLATPEQVRRFHTEAERAGSLDHPHIVPIYEVGEEHGQHYFTMKLIEGGRLSDHVPRLQGNLKAAAQLVATMARAVHYAHERGILHRDLKPGNILVDGDGQPHVTDFGLAKHLEPSELSTQSGAIVGTPSYMAPEQAAGHRHLTTAADVYSLGAILYELLTGRPPFQADNVFDMVLKVMEQDPQRPATLNLRVDRDLETICLTCLAKEPQRRYPSALALAQDLERFLAGEPIRARPVGYWERVLKWVRRRPAAAALLAVSCLAVVALALLGWWHNLSLKDALDETKRQRRMAEVNAVMAENNAQRAETNAKAAKAQEKVARTNAAEARAKAAEARRERRAAEKNAEEAKRQRDLAKASADKRLEVVDDLLIRLDGRLANYRGADTVRMEFLQEFLKLSRQLLDERPTDPAVRRKTARVHYRIADLWYDDEGYNESDASFQSALDLQEKLVKEFPKDPVYQNDLAFSLAHRANLLQTVRRYPEALNHYDRAIGLWDALAKAPLPDKPEYMDRAAYYCFKRAVLFEVTEKPRAAEARYCDALRRQEELVKAYPKRQQSFTYLAQTATSLAMLLSDSRPPRATEAQKYLERTLAASRQARTLSPTSKTYFRNLRDCYTDVADFLKEHGRHAALVRLAADYRRDFPNDANETYNAACYTANAVRLVQADRQLSVERRRQLSETYGAKAVDLLRKAIQEGYTQRAHLDKDSDIDPLRQRQDYRDLLVELDKRAPAQALSPVREYNALSQEANSIQGQYQYRLSRAITPAARKKVLRKKPRFEEYANRFIRLAEKHRDSPIAVEALFWILDNSTPNPGQKLSPSFVRAREKALRVLERDHFQKAELADVCQRLADSPMSDTDKFLETAVLKHPQREVRGLAGYALALSLAKQAEDLGLNDRSRREELTQKAEKELQRVIKEYPTVASGNSTLGEVAKAKLYWLRHLTVGRAAPEIEGVDFQGKKFKLSDYRGKVILLDFWANWCGFCRQMYPHERQLVQRLKNQPFALLGVNCDDDQADVLREIKKEKLDWRSWWDGGPGGGRISKQWQVNGFPTIYLIDHRGIIRYMNLRGQRIDAAVDKLLKEVPKKRS